MASIPGTQFNITGASGSQGLLSPRSGWRAYVFPRGGYASQDSTGATITFDSASVASRFTANNWVQVGLSTANIRQVSGVGGNSIGVNTAVTVSENDRIFLIGNTQPTVTGGSATYLVPSSVIYQRDDDGSDLYTNSMITSNSDGLVQFFASANYYDVLIQDGDRANQGSIVDLPVGAVEGFSTVQSSTFGSTVVINAALGVTGWATFGQTVTLNATLGVTGWATFGSTVTMHATLGVTGNAAFSTATFSSGVTFAAGITVSGGSVNLPTDSITTVTPFKDGLFTTAKFAAAALIGATFGVNNTLFGISTNWTEIGGGTASFCRISITPSGNDSKVLLMGFVPALNTVNAVSTVHARIAEGTTIHCASVAQTGGSIDEGTNVACAALIDGYTGAKTFTLEAKYVSNASSVFGASDTKARIIGVEFKNLL